MTITGLIASRLVGKMQLSIEDTVVVNELDLLCSSKSWDQSTTATVTDLFIQYLWGEPMLAYHITLAIHDQDAGHTMSCNNADCPAHGTGPCDCCAGFS